jgi:hypothetical protein
MKIYDIITLNIKKSYLYPILLYTAYVGDNVTVFI